MSLLYAVQGGRIREFDVALTDTSGPILEVPANHVFQLLYMSAVYVCDATVGNRRFELVIRQIAGDGENLLQFHNYLQAESVSRRFLWGPSDLGSTWHNRDAVATLPQPCLIMPGSDLRLNVTSGDAGDTLNVVGVYMDWAVPD